MEATIGKSGVLIANFEAVCRKVTPDLNQAILLLLTENRAGIPMFMKAASGNVTDKTSFKQVVSEHIKSFKAALNARYFIGDAALYVAETVQELSQQDQLFISRVPLNIGAAKELVQSAPLRSMVEVEGFEHYESVETLSDYAGVVQRWVLFRNNQSQKTEQKTLTRRMQKKSLKEFKELEKLGKKPLGAVHLLRRSTPAKPTTLTTESKEKRAVSW
ncbi:IS1634 family transposase [Endozoicomonas euniceicola]|uniref:IS1634 family transposase n=1 Tax=Endozoicomonas euniceicola TaxID=1234143 RepID=A0ABY6GT92_9GAMM|nr:IS1634 family transposase [Endozoicomonas euniceicola]UYM15980.1 IS1634 family transposase [Endozoicomonas euniceicola]